AVDALSRISTSAQLLTLALLLFLFVLLEKAEATSKSFCRSLQAFGRNLEKMHVTWTQFEKKRDKIATLHEDDQDLAYSAWRRRHKFL
ncbi:hypothetical protein Tco_1545007, partial [Tanacetum coccineum]